MKKLAPFLAAAISLTGAFAFAWPTPVNLGSKVNTTSNDESPYVTDDGLTLYFSCSGRAGGFGGYDIWRSAYSGGSWQTPDNLGSVINGTSDDYTPYYRAATPPELYFTSYRSGGVGSGDIWLSRYQSGSWTTPTNVRPVNSSAADASPWIVGSPARMFLSSTRSGGQGGWDIWMSTWTGSAWGTPVNLGPPVNTSGWESDPSLTADGSTLYFRSNRSGGLGQDDFWVATWSGSNWGNVRNVGAPVNTSSYERWPCISPDGNKLYFASNRPGGVGNFDIYCSDDTVTVVPTSLGRVKALFK